MKERKNIDRLYQEKFRDFAPEPKPELWDNIAEKLQEKDRKKPFIIPLWLKVGGVAAVLALMLGGYFFSQNNFTQTQVVFELEDAAKPQINFPEINKNEPFQNASEILKNVNEATYSTSEGASNSSTNNNSALASENTNSRLQKTSCKSAEKEESENMITDEVSEQNSAIATEDRQNSEEEINTHQDFINPNSKNEQQPESLAENSDESEKEESLSRKDSLEVAEQLAQIEEEKNFDKEEDLIAEASKKKLRLSTFAAPVFFDNIGNGSAIDPQFAGNNTNSQVSVAYGMNLAYAISEKIKIRSGISKVAMSYNVEDIVFSASINPNNISSINYESERNNVNLENAAPSGLPTDLGGNDGSNFSSVNNMALPGEINQQFGFIEVPLEIEYRLIDSKIGLNLIAGGSSLFLDENSIKVNTNNQNTRIGEANNINKVSFSTNVGVGVDYKLTDNFKLNVEPIFKYQLDTFNNAPGVRPFYFGVYSGISFNF